MMKKLLVCALALFFVASCSNKYQEYSYIEGGYFNKELANNAQVVGYKSYGLRDDKKNIDFSLLRASEMSIENGSHYFWAHPYKRRSVSRYNRRTRVRTNSNREIGIAVKFLPKHKKSEIVFNAHEVCSMISGEDRGYLKDDFPRKVNCGLENRKLDKVKFMKKIENYHKIFKKVLKGNYIPK